MDLQTLAAIIGILSGMVTLAGGVASAVGRLREPAQAQAPRVPVHAGAYPYPPPASNAPGPYPQSGAAPPAGYRWPAAPQPGAAQPGYPQTPQPGAPAPRPGYGAPPQQWDSPRSYPAPAAQPGYIPQSVPRRRWFTHPRIAILAAITLLSSGLIGVVTGSLFSSDSSSISTTNLSPAMSLLVTLLTVIVVAGYFLSLALGAWEAIRLRRWGWLVSILLLVAYGALAFGIFGPTTPPQSKSPSYPPYAPRRM